jgi:hypothetical protein
LNILNKRNIVQINDGMENIKELNELAVILELPRQRCRIFLMRPRAGGGGIFGASLRKGVFCSFSSGKIFEKFFREVYTGPFQRQILHLCSEMSDEKAISLEFTSETIII